MRWLLAWLLLIGAAQAQVAQISGPAVTVSNLPTKTVATLPACNAGLNGQVYVVTDALLPTLAGVVVGGGAVNVLVRCASGTGWLVG